MGDEGKEGEVAWALSSFFPWPIVPWTAILGIIGASLCRRRERGGEGLGGGGGEVDFDKSPRNGRLSFSAFFAAKCAAFFPSE